MLKIQGLVLIDGEAKKFTEYAKDMYEIRSIINQFFDGKKDEIIAFVEFGEKRKTAIKAKNSLAFAKALERFIGYNLIYHYQ
jgi:hypothetical protein